MELLIASGRVPTPDEMTAMQAEYERLSERPDEFEAFQLKVASAPDGEGFTDAELAGVTCPVLEILGDLIVPKNPCDTCDVSDVVIATKNKWQELLPAAGVSASAFLLFALLLPGWSHGLLVVSLVAAWLINRELGRDLTLIGVGISIVSLTSVEADVSWDRFVTIGAVLIAAVAAPLLLDRFWLKRKAITFPWKAGKKWTRVQWAYVVAVPVLGWAILPFYFIRSGAYLNWPHITDWSELARFFVGVNFVGLWDELFFVCTCFALLRRHFTTWPANFLQTTIFVSFLWELGYRAWGPFLTIPFALLQGWIFNKTRSLTYVVVVHLLFDVIVFLAIVHAHNRDWLPIFFY